MKRAKEVIIRKERLLVVWSLSRWKYEKNIKEPVRKPPRPVLDERAAYYIYQRRMGL